MSRAAFIVDVHNWYIGCQKKFPNKSVNYSAIVSSLNDSDALMFRVAYGRQSEDKVETFAKALRKLNFDVRFGGGPYNIDMALCVAKLIEHRAIDRLILGTSYFEAGKILEYAQSRGIYTTSIGFNVPEAFSRFADVVEISEMELQDRPDEVLSPLPIDVAA